MPKKPLPPITGHAAVKSAGATLAGHVTVRPLEEVILDLGRRSQAGSVLLLTTQLDDALERRIRYSMPQLSNTMRDKLFSGYGPFATFNVRIDVAYAMGYINADAHHDFHVMRAIRNRFAHPRGLVHFESNKIRDLIRTFKGYKKKDHADHFAFFLKKVEAAWDTIIPEVTLASYLKDHYDPGKSGASPEKS